MRYNFAKEKSNYPDNHSLMTYLVILLFAVMAISLITFGCLLCERLWVRRKIEIINHT